MSCMFVLRLCLNYDEFDENDIAMISRMTREPKKKTVLCSEHITRELNYHVLYSCTLKG